VGPPFGPRARPWAITIIAITATVSTGLGLALAAITHRIEAASIGLVVPSVLWFSQFPSRRELDFRPPGPSALLKLPFRRLYDRMDHLMAEDMQDWCYARLGAASAKPQWIADATNYYYNQVAGRLKDTRTRVLLGDWRKSILRKTGMVNLTSLDPAPARLRGSLQMHPSTSRIAEDDLARLASRLASDALNEFELFLSTVYRLGYTRMPVYMSAPPISRTQAWARPSSGPPPRTRYRAER
jgi:hypothetical protein